MKATVGLGLLLPNPAVAGLTAFPWTAEAFMTAGAGRPEGFQFGINLRLVIGLGSIR